MEVSSKPFYDFTIIGAGASGLFLAQALLQCGLLDKQTLCIVESDTTKANDRTWCYWNKGPITADPYVSKVWSGVQNVYASASGMTPYQYHHIHSADFYKHLKQELSGCSNIHWVFDKIIETTQQHECVTVAGLKYQWTTQKVFTAVAVNQSPSTPDYREHVSRKHIYLKQSFVGWRVQTQATVFNAEQMTLMDFNIPQQNHTQFLYVLPFTSNEALLELTRFGSEELTQQEAELELKRQMDALNCSYTIREVEIGCIPMSTVFDATRSHHPKDNSIIPIGTLAGAIKPTTGYGFKRMHTHAHAIAQAILHNQPIPTTQRKRRFQLYDVLLLTILKKYPEKGKPIFEQLFKSQPLPRILKFLDEETSIREEILIFAKLPIPLFVRTLVNHLLRL
jgi:lycopene beta-cyclase